MVLFATQVLEGESLVIASTLRCNPQLNHVRDKTVPSPWAFHSIDSANIDLMLAPRSGLFWGLVARECVSRIPFVSSRRFACQMKNAARSSVPEALGDGDGPGVRAPVSAPTSDLSGSV